MREDRKLSRLLLLADSAFPTGAFAHSWGLEWAIRHGWVTGAASLSAWIGDALRYGVAPLEGRALVRAGQAAGEGAAGAPAGNLARRLARLSDEVASFLPSGEARAAGGQLGRSLLTAAGAAFAGLRSSPRYAAALQAARGGAPRLQQPVAWGFLGAELKIDAGALAQAYLLNTARQWTQVALRTVPLGQSEALAVAGGLLDEITELARGAARARRPLAAVTPGWDLAVLGHGQLEARYFRS